MSRPPRGPGRDTLDEQTAAQVREHIRRTLARRLLPVRYLAESTGLTLPQVQSYMVESRSLRAKIAVRLLLAVCE